MRKLGGFLNGPGGAFVLAVVVFALALVGHAGIGLALAMGGVMVVYGLVMLAGRRWDPIAIIAAPAADERAASLHLRAAAAAGQVMAAVIVGGFLYDLARGAVDHSIWPPMGGVFGLTYLTALFMFWRRG